MVERYIGVDFGTTASAIHFTDRIEENLLQSNTLIFPGGHQKYVPTVIYEPTDMEETLYGWDAEAMVTTDPVRIRLDFKMALLDPARREEAEHYIRIFYKYMYQVYQKRAVKVPGQDYDEKHTFTLVTYPAKFSDDQRRVLEKAAEDAGFPNVTMLSESEAAMWYAVGTENEEVQSVFSALNKETLTIMSADMGAGTADITIFEYDYRKRRLISVLGLSRDAGINFGGREIDHGFMNFYVQQLGRGLYETIGSGDVEYGERILLHDVRVFKETTVSDTLNKGQEVPYPPGILFQAAANQGAFSTISIDRNQFEKILSGYLKQFPMLIEHTLKNAGKRRQDIDVVVLTGGNSGWYFVDDMLCDPDGSLALKALDVNGKTVLPLIRFAGNERIAVAIGAAMWQPLKSAKELNEQGENYFYGRGVSQDYAEAVKWYLESAEQGYAEAQSNLGYCYLNGLGVTQNYTEAVKWFRKSAEQGCVEAQNNLGTCYADGLGVTRNYIEAIKWYRKSAEQGYTAAQICLGLCYLNGLGVTLNMVEAVKWFRKSAEQGDAKGQNSLGTCYADGLGVTRNYTEAVKWFRKSAEQGYAAAQNNLGVCYRDGHGVAQDYAEAVKWYRKSAEQGCAEAQNNLGVCYRDGHGVAQDYAEAVKWYRKSAEQGNAAAQCNLGVCYLYGIGVDKDHAEALKWCRRSAKQGFAEGQYQLGEFYYCGYHKDLGILAEDADSERWQSYLKSANQGFAAAQCKVGEHYYYRHRPVDKSLGIYEAYTEAVKWFRKSAEQGYGAAQYYLGMCYERGEGVDHDIEEAKKWYKLAINKWWLHDGWLSPSRAEERLKAIETQERIDNNPIIRFFRLFDT